VRGAVGEWGIARQARTFKLGLVILGEGLGASLDAEDTPRVTSVRL
jgi:hypothetical protein